jgi:hypothetical protein
MITGIPMETGASYPISGADFPGPGTYFLVETTTPTCGSAIVSNEVTITILADVSPPMVTAPGGATVTQTLCQ